MPPSDRSQDSDEEDFDLDLEDEGAANSEPGDYEPGEHSVVGGADDGTEEADDDSNTDDSDDSDDDEDEDGEGEENDDDDDEERLQQELQESLAMDIDAELRELEASAAAAPSIGEEDRQPATGHSAYDDDEHEPGPHGQARAMSPGLNQDPPPPLDVPLLTMEDDGDASMHIISSPREPKSPTSVAMASPPRRRRSPSPATQRHYQLFAPTGTATSTSSLALNGTAKPPSSQDKPRTPRSYAVEALCALPHLVPTHSLASSYCMTHLLTGSQDGYIRNYDIFSAVNGKNFLTQPQRQHAGVVEGLFKSGQIRCWWENPVLAESQRRIGLFSNTSMPSSGPAFPHADEDSLSPVYSMIMHSDALWALAGSEDGHISLFTVRHGPGKIIHAMDKHRGPVSAMAMDYDEKGFFSAGWDGEAVQWDLNTGKNVRNFTAHGAQIAAIAIRPDHPGPYVDPTSSGGVVYKRKGRDKSRERREREQEQEDENEGRNNPAGVKSEYPSTLADVSMGDPLTGADAFMHLEESKPHIQQDPNPYTQQDQPPVPQEPAPHPSEPAPMETDGDNDADTKSDGSFDPLFDEEGDEGDDATSVPPPAPQQPASVNPYSNITFSAAPTSNLNTKPIVPGAPQSHFVTFPLGLSGPPVPVNPPPGGVQSYFHTIHPPQNTKPPPPSQGGQQFQFQLAKPPKTSIATKQRTTSTAAKPAPHNIPPPVPAPPVQLSGIAPPKNAPPLLDSAVYQNFSGDLVMTAFIDGQVILWDRRAPTTGCGVGRLWMSEKTPPWCLSAAWSWDGGQIFAGRRNGTIDVWDVRLMGKSGVNNTPRLLKTIRNPPSSGVVSCLAPFPDCRHIVCASIDNIRLWNVADAGGEDSSMAARPSNRSGFLFKIIPGHHGGYVSQMLIDPGARFMVTSSSNRGWHGESTKTVFVHDVKQIF